MFLDALKVAFLRHLPTPASLQSAFSASEELKLSTYEEVAAVHEARRTLDEKIVRVRDAARGLLGALDVDQADRLDYKWLCSLMQEHSLPIDDVILPMPGLEKAMAALFANEQPTHVLCSPAAIDQVCQQVLTEGQWLDGDTHRALQTVLSLIGEALVAAAPFFSVEGASFSVEGVEGALQFVVGGERAKHASLVGREAVADKPLAFDTAPVAEFLKLSGATEIVQHFTAVLQHFTAVLEYFAAEMIELTGKSVKARPPAMMLGKEHMAKAIRSDEELSALAVAITKAA